MDCISDALLECYLNNELDPETLCALQRHALSCTACREELNYWQFLYSLQYASADALNDTLPSGFSARVMEKLQGIHEEKFGE